MNLTFSQLVIEPGQHLLLRDIDWDAFEALLDELGEKRAARFSYSRGTLEIMVPLAIHEDDKTIIGNLVELMLEEMDIEFRALGSTTFKNRGMQQAVEPDECFYIQNEARIRGKRRIDLDVDPPPDLAIEIDITARTRFDNYERLGIPELWRFTENALEIHVLSGEHYRQQTQSRQFPAIPVSRLIPEYVTLSREIGRNAMMKRFRSELRAVLARA